MTSYRTQTVDRDESTAREEFLLELRAALDNEEPVEKKTMDAITLRLKTSKRAGFLNRERAEKILTRRHKPTAFLKNEDALLMYYKSAFCFEQCGKWQEAANSLLMCAKLLRRQSLHSQAGAVFSEAAEHFMRSDVEEASKAYIQSVSAYCDAERFDIAAKLEFIVAGIHWKNKHWDEALSHFQKCATYSKGEQLLEFVDIALERMAECFIEVRLAAVYICSFDCLSYPLAGRLFFSGGYVSELCRKLCGE